MSEHAQVLVKGVRVGLVEDRRHSADDFAEHLRAAGYTVQELAQGSDAENSFQNGGCDLLILFGLRRGPAGTQLLTRLRQLPPTKLLPIIVISDRSSESELIQVLDSGADDYVAKPLSIPEFTARMEAHLRRRTPERSAQMFTVGDTQIDHQARLVRRRGKVIEMSPTVLRLLELFMAKPGVVHSRGDILTAVWGQEVNINERTIDVHVGRLRRALLSAWQSDPITTLRGVGYRYDPK